MRLLSLYADLLLLSCCFVFGFWLVLVVLCSAVSSHFLATFSCAQHGGATINSYWPAAVQPSTSHTLSLRLRPPPPPRIEVPPSCSCIASHFIYCCWWHAIVTTLSCQEVVDTLEAYILYVYVEHQIIILFDDIQISTDICLVSLSPSSHQIHINRRASRLNNISNNHQTTTRLLSLCQIYFPAYSWWDSCSCPPVYISGFDFVLLLANIISKKEKKNKQNIRCTVSVNVLHKTLRFRFFENAFYMLSGYIWKLQQYRFCFKFI